MEQFEIHKVNFKIDDENKGTKSKYWSKLNGKNVLIKLNKYLDKDLNKEIRSWNVSEKLYSEISKFLGFNCVDTDLIINEEGLYGIASYDYKSKKMNSILSGDDLFFSVFNRRAQKKGNNIKQTDYTYENILKILIFYNRNGELVKDFNRILIIDALTGEMDRHYENWGIYYSNNSEYKLLPAYDNSSCLLHHFRDKDYLQTFIENNDISNYAIKSRCKISINGKIYTHFDFIDYLLNNLPDEIRMCFINDIKKIKKLTDDYIKSLVYRIPECLCTNKHKDLVIEYLIFRKNILLSKVEEI